MSLALVYLLWGPLGPERVREFVASYGSHAPGYEHELFVLLNGVDSRQRSSLLSPLEAVEHSLLELDTPVQDLAAYGQAAEWLKHDLLCCLNSYSVILADDWLGSLARAATTSGIGLAGASGSSESQAEWVRGSVKHWLRQLIGSRAVRRDYPRFPNPHIRTTAFAMERQLILDLGLKHAHDKQAAYLLESGWSSITRGVQERGMRAVVVGRDGRVYDIEEWATSRTYRSGAQENLLVSDNRTRDWSEASRRLRRRLSKDAWGRPS